MSTPSLATFLQALRALHSDREFLAGQNDAHSRSNLLADVRSKAAIGNRQLAVRYGQWTLGDCNKLNTNKSES